MTGDLFSQMPDGQTPRELTPGAHHVPGWLSQDQQADLVEQFREWCNGPVPLRAASVRGHLMSVETVCLGWHWAPYAYTREARDVNGRTVLPFPDWMVDLGQQAIAAVTHDDDAATAYLPDTALVNYYHRDARLGMHQDKDERSAAPVVSLSIGDTCHFRFGNTENRGKPYQDVALGSGDLFVFGGASRLAYHGVTRIIADTAPPGCGLDSGRINITMRVTGMA